MDGVYRDKLIGDHLLSKPFREFPIVRGIFLSINRSSDMDKRNSDRYKRSSDKGDRNSDMDKRNSDRYKRSSDKDDRNSDQ